MVDGAAEVDAAGMVDTAMMVMAVHLSPSFVTERSYVLKTQFFSMVQLDSQGMAPAPMATLAPKLTP